MNQNPHVAQGQIDEFMRLIGQEPTPAVAPAPRRIQRAGVTRRRPRGQRKARRKMAKASKRRNR